MTLKMNTLLSWTTLYFCIIKFTKAVESPIPDNYGPFEIQFDKYELCKGPKSRDLVNFTLVVKKEGDNYMGYANMIFKDSATVGEMRIAVYSVKNGRKTVLWNYRVNKPCQHFAVAPYFVQFVKANAKCVVNKGTYAFICNYTETAKVFFGKSFFYGEYLMKVTITSDRGNIMCLLVQPVFAKKT